MTDRNSTDESQRPLTLFQLMGSVLAAMFGGLSVYLSFYLVAFIRVGELKALPLFWLDQFAWGVIASGAAGIVVTCLTKPPARENVERFFPS